MVLDDFCDGDSSPSPLPHEAMEEKLFDDMVHDLFSHEPKGIEDSLEKDHLFTTAETPVF